MSDIIFSVDVETSGPRPGVHQLLSLGAVAYDTSGIEYGEFSVNFVPLDDHRDDPSTTAWWESQPTARAALQINQKYLGNGMLEFEHFIKSLCNTGSAPVFLADPAIFDYPWVDWAFHMCSLRNPFHFDSKHGLKVIDMTSFVMGGRGIQNTARRAEIDLFDVGLSPHTHIAVEDARHQGELFFKIAQAIDWPVR